MQNQKFNILIISQLIDTMDIILTGNCPFIMTSIQNKPKLIAESGGDHDYCHSTNMLITVMNLTSVSQQGENPCFLAPEPPLN